MALDLRRRAFLIGSAVVGAAGAALYVFKKKPPAIVETPVAPPSAPVEPGMAIPAGQAVLPDRYRDVLRAMVARIYPDGDSADGAVAAKAYDYIDHELRRSNMQNTRRLLMNGAVTLDRVAFGQLKKGFVQATPEEQDTVIAAVQSGEGAPKSFNGDDFVAAAVAMTIEGMFCDPVYGGNAGELGWKSIDWVMQSPRPKTP